MWVTDQGESITMDENVPVGRHLEATKGSKIETSFATSQDRRQNRDGNENISSEPSNEV